MWNIINKWKKLRQLKRKDSSLCQPRDFFEDQSLQHRLLVATHFDFRTVLKPGDYLDAFDSANTWRIANIIAMD